MLLDDNFDNTSQEKKYSSVIDYWEKKRKLYNIIMLIPGVISCIPYYLKFGITFFEFCIILLIGLIANLFYTFGCSVILLGVYYLGNIFNSTFWSKLFLIFGTLFSLALLFLVCGSTNYYQNSL